MRAGDSEETTVAFGQGPVNALDLALRKSLTAHYPVLADVRLLDFKVRILPPLANGAGTESVTRVTIECQDKKEKRWTTIGVSENIIEASFEALSDAYCYKLFSDSIPVA